MNDYIEFFKQATGGRTPYPYQVRLAESVVIPQMLSVPTGVGKTAAAIVSWLFRRRIDPSSTPRRLVYCLPMRTLVEQTRDAAEQWLRKLALPSPPQVHLLMGGVDGGEWFKHPERDAILIGTQDMLLSRALNRGYGMSRYQWPVDYSLLNNDSLWVIDETQLMGVGLTTSAQLAGLRQKLSTYGNCQTLWMSATLDPTAIATIDHPLPESGQWAAESIQEDDRESESVNRILTAAKPCKPATTSLTAETKKAYPSSLAVEVFEAHRPSTLTLVVLNRVSRAQDVFAAVQKLVGKSGSGADVCLIHSRFRPVDRQETQATALDENLIPPGGRIIIATQAIEAGVDISATTLFTELSPWSSLVQRFGRCNRRGVCGLEGTPPAQVYWIDIDTEDARKAAEPSLPYMLDELDRARKCLLSLEDVGPRTLQGVSVEEPRPIVHVLRRKDLLELFDTTPDLSGNDLDVSRYIREGDDVDVQVFWRNWDLKDKNLRGKPPVPRSEYGVVEFPAPSREELCNVSIAALRGKTGFIAKAAAKDFRCFTWDPLEREWQVVRPEAARPGITVLFHAKAGGYDPALGWTGDVKQAPVEDRRPTDGQANQAMSDDDAGSMPVQLSLHLRDVGMAAESLRECLNGSLATSEEGFPWNEIVQAAWWHDVGKAHPAFQGALRRTIQELPAEELWAKSGLKGRLYYEMPNGSKRAGFRHELASALAWLNQHDGEAQADLVAYLIAAHHGKVRMSIRSMPNEKPPPDSDRLFARGIWEGDALPSVEIGNADGDASEEVTLSLDLMKLGEHNGRRSWLARTLKLREAFGPFKLAYLETLVRVADWRGSQAGEKQ